MSINTETGHQGPTGNDSKSCEQGLKPHKTSLDRSENMSSSSGLGIPPSRTFSPLNEDGCYATTNDFPRLVTSRLIVEPIVYLVMPLGKGDKLLSDLRAKRFRMQSNRYPLWFLYLCDIAWATDVAYRSVAEHIKMFWR